MATDAGGVVSEQRTVVVTSRSFGTGGADPVAELARQGLEVVRAASDHHPGKLAAPLADAVAWIAGLGPIGPAQLDLAPSLRVVARYGVGVDAVDRSALARRGIVLTNTPGANTEAVADHAVGLMLVALRSTLAGDRAVRTGRGVPPPGRELGRCTVGLVGYGAIGRAVDRRVRAFGAEVLAYDPYLEDAPAQLTLVALDELLARSHVLSLHAPPAAEPLITAGRLGLCPPGAVLVNTARAELVDEAALAAALEAGELSAAAVDVFGTHHGDASSPLRSAPNVILTPHIAGRTTDAIDRMSMTAAQDVIRVLRGGSPRFPVLAPDEEEAT